MMQLSDPSLLVLTPRRTGTVFIHPQALVEGATLGAGTRVWAFAHLLPGAVVGKDCNFCDHTFVEGDVWIGDRVTVKSGVYLWAGTRIEDDVFLGPNVTFTNDRLPRSKQYPERFEGVVVRRGASIGAGAVLLPGVEIGEYAMIGAGAVVTRSIPPHALAFGNPAQVEGKVCVCGRRLLEDEAPPHCSNCQRGFGRAGSAA